MEVYRYSYVCVRMYKFYIRSMGTSSPTGYKLSNYFEIFIIIVIVPTGIAALSCITFTFKMPTCIYLFLP